ncbi:MAG: ATP-binding protein [Desulfovibrio sp.]|uniref:sensor histidine kinase n=1 Tax=Desulfovibrio sp. 7SRBS1 TaxID=3378064 RepID=UPI003B3DA475
METMESNAQRLMKEIRRSATLENLISLRYVAMGFIPMTAFMLYLQYDTFRAPSTLLRLYIILASVIYLFFSTPPVEESGIRHRHQIVEILYGTTIAPCMILLNGFNPLYAHSQSIFIMTMFGLAAFFRVEWKKALFFFIFLGGLEAFLIRNEPNWAVLQTQFILCAVVTVISLLLSRLVYLRWENSYKTKRLIEEQKLELERKERELRESERKYKALVQNFPNGIVAMFDYDLRFILADGKGLTQFGLLGCALQNKIIWDCLPQELASTLGPLFRQTLEGQESTTEISLNDHTLEMHLLPLRDAEGNIAAGMVVSMDITERKRSEALREDVERMTRHDIKTPLNAIMGMTDLLLEDDLPPDIQEGIKIIRKSGLRVFNIVNQSLNMLKMERGTYHFHGLPVNLLTLIDKIWEELRPLANARQVGIDLTLNGKTPPANGHFMVLGEELLCYTMLANLLKNAVEASPRNAVISVDLTNSDPSRKIRIQNLGEVPSQIRKKFFEKFVTYGKPGGTGLGAYSARLIAITLGGSIHLDATIPGETIIHLTLPS